MNLIYAMLVSLVAHVGLCAALYFSHLFGFFSFYQPPQLLATRQSKAAVQLVASVASEGEQTKKELEVRIERPPPTPKKEQEIEPPEFVRRPPKIRASRELVEVPLKYLEPTAAPAKPREVTEVAADFTPPPRVPRDEREPVEPKVEVEAVASAASPFSQAVAGAEVDELPVQNPINVAPAYPPDALASGRQGVVTLRVKVNAAGTVSDLSVHATSGSTSLDNAALNGVRAWRFTPARRVGAAVPSEVLVPVRFSIRGR